jgi:hypothetical protein
MLYTDLRPNPADEGCDHPLECLQIIESDVVCTACGEILA